MIGYIKHFDNNKIISFNVNDKKRFKSYTKIWEKVSVLMNIVFDSEPAYGDNDKYIKAKLKSYGEEVNINFPCKNIPKQNASYKCFSLIKLNSVARVMKVLSSILIILKYF